MKDHHDPNTDSGFYEITTISGTHLYITADAWLETLRGLDFPLDGEGSLALMSLPDAAQGEVALVFAPPANSVCEGGPEGRPLRLELAFVRGDNTALMALAAPVATPIGEAVLFTAVDLGKADNRKVVERFANQELIHFIVVHPQTGAVRGSLKAASTALLAQIQGALVVTMSARELETGEGLLAVEELHAKLIGADDTPADI